MHELTLGDVAVEVATEQGNAKEQRDPPQGEQNPCPRCRQAPRIGLEADTDPGPHDSTQGHGETHVGKHGRTGRH